MDDIRLSFRRTLRRFKFYSAVILSILGNAHRLAGYRR